MPWDKVMSKFKSGKLNSGSKSGPPVKNKKQALAIMLSEKLGANMGKSEYKAKGNFGPSKKVRAKHGL